MKRELLLKNLRRIRNIPDNTIRDCHEDHEAMSEALNKLIGRLLKK